MSLNHNNDTHTIYLTSVDCLTPKKTTVQLCWISSRIGFLVNEKHYQQSRNQGSVLSWYKICLKITLYNFFCPWKVYVVREFPYLTHRLINQNNSEGSTLKSDTKLPRTFSLLSSLRPAWQSDLGLSVLCVCWCLVVVVVVVNWWRRLLLYD